MADLCILGDYICVAVQLTSPLTMNDALLGCSINETGHATPHAAPFVEMRHCGWHAAPPYCNVSMRDGN